MAGMFELFADSDSSFRFQLTAPDGTVMALSKPFPDKRAAVAGIAGACVPPCRTTNRVEARTGSTVRRRLRAGRR